MSIDIDTDAEESRATRKVRESGNSVVVSIPRTLLREADFLVGDDVEVAASFDGGSIVIRSADASDDDAVEASAEK